MHMYLAWAAWPFFATWTINIDSITTWLPHGAVELYMCVCVPISQALMAFCTWNLVQRTCISAELVLLHSQAEIPRHTHTHTSATHKFAPGI